MNLSITRQRNLMQQAIRYYEDIANHARSQRGEILTLEMLKAELIEVKELVAKTPAQKAAKDRHIKALEAGIQYKTNHPS